MPDKPMKPDERYEHMARETDWGHTTEVPIIRADNTIHCPLCGESRSVGDRAGRSYTCSFKIALALERAAVEGRIDVYNRLPIVDGTGAGKTMREIITIELAALRKRREELGK